MKSVKSIQVFREIYSIQFVIKFFKLFRYNADKVHNKITTSSCPTDCAWKSMNKSFKLGEFSDNRLCLEIFDLVTGYLPNIPNCRSNGGSSVCTNRLIVSLTGFTIGA